MGASKHSYHIEINGGTVRDLRDISQAEARGAVLFARSCGFPANVVSVCNQTGMLEESVGKAMPDVLVTEAVVRATEGART